MTPELQQHLVRRLLPVNLRPLVIQRPAMGDINYAALDPGIRELVRRLRLRGWNTMDSGDGVSKPAVGRTMDCPHVAVVLPFDAPIQSATTALLWDVKRFTGGDRWIACGSYSTADGVPIIVAWEPTTAVKGNRQ